MLHTDLLTTLVQLLPMDITIDPNSNGLPGIGQLRKIVGASMTVGLILDSVTHGRRETKRLHYLGHRSPGAAADDGR